MRNLFSRIVMLMLAVGLLVGSSLTPQPALAQETATSDIRITITESFIAHMLTTPPVQEMLAGLPTPVQNPRLDLKSGNQLDLTINTVLPPPFGETDLTLTISLAVANSDLTLTIETLTIRGASLPANNPLLAGQIAPIQEQIQTAASDGLAGLTESAGLELAGLSTTDTLIMVALRSTGE